MIDFSLSPLSNSGDIADMNRNGYLKDISTASKLNGTQISIAKFDTITCSNSSGRTYSHGNYDDGDDKNPQPITTP